MKNTPYYLGIIRRSLFAGGVLVSSMAALQAQQADEEENPDEGEIYELSVFSVEESGDIGYLAQNTLAGSRINTSLKDTGVAVSVMTEEFLDDLGATSMKDVILFSNNTLPEYGDSAPNYNGNPMVGNEQYLMRIRGQQATYMRNYFTWESSSDFYNVSRVDQSRGPNSILFGFGAAGGIVNTTTKQASLGDIDNEVSLTVGSWGRWRGALDLNQVVVPDVFAVRVNTMAESGESWREFEEYESERLHIASTIKVNDNSTLRAEFETGSVDDNVARTWLAIDQAWQWREDGRPTYDGAVWDWPDSDYITQTWSPHVVYVANDGSVMDWQNSPYTYMANANWSHLEMTDENLAIIPTESNLAGPGATRSTDYDTFSVVFESKPTSNFSYELAYNHQNNDFSSYDANAGGMSRYGYLGDSTNIWGDAANWLPADGNWAANPYAGQLYVENNWTRRTNWVEVDTFRATAAYDLDLDKLGHHNIAGMVQRTLHDSWSQEDAEVWVGAAFGEDWDSSSQFAEFDSNRVFRRYYFEEGNASDIHVPSWDTPLSYTLDGVSYYSGWAPNQEINAVDKTQDTFLLALQSYFFNDRLVTTMGFRHDSIDEDKYGNARDGNNAYFIDYDDITSRSVSADTMSFGAVFHINDKFSIFANTSNSRNIPSVNQRIIGMDFAPLPEGVGTDFGMKFDLFEGKLYATVDYYTTDYENTAEWGNIGSDIRDRNNSFLWSFYDAGLITAAERDARILNANSYLEDRKADGWEFEMVANPTHNWRITANFSINHVIKDNIMNEVVEWADDAVAYWYSLADADYNFGGGDWDTLEANIGWMMDYINEEIEFNGKQARGEREYGASLYTRYFFTEGLLKGFSIGGGTRYQSPNAITWDEGTLVEGNDIFLCDLVLGYAFELDWGKIDLQLNVSNLFDDDTYQIYTSSWWDSSRAERIGLQEPRKLTFTTKLSF